MESNNKDQTQQQVEEEKKESCKYSKIYPTDKTLNTEHLLKFSKEILVQFIVENKQKLILPKNNQRPREQRPFDFSKYRRLKVAFKFSYLGKNYKGLVVQKNTEDTIEHQIYTALKRTCLIPPDQPISYSHYTRCGRTDKGVSALGNVCSLYVRESKDNNYCQMLNHVLPHDIRMIACSEVQEHFDARFSCIYREYKYFFCKGNMNIDRIQKACKKLIGLHDFRNFCKKDESMRPEDDGNHDGEEQNFMRRIFNFTVESVHINSDNDRLSLYMCIIRGSAFLWHQVRCMMAVLFIIGRGDDDDSVIDLLFDTEKIKERPNYEIANENGLILSECGFDDVRWENNMQSDLETYNVFKRQFEENAIQMCLNEVMMKAYDNTFIEKQKIMSSGFIINNLEWLESQSKHKWIDVLQNTTSKKKHKESGNVIRKAVQQENKQIKQQNKKRDDKFSDKQKQQQPLNQ